MKTKDKHQEDGATESHKEDGMEAGGAGDPGAAASPPPANPDHEDQAQDIELFKQLLAQHAPEHADNEEALKMCQSAYSEAKASGMDHDEAMKCAGYGMKCASLLGKKQARESAESAEAQKEAGLTSELHDQDAAGSMPGKTGMIPLKHSLPPKKADQSSDKSSDGADVEESSVKESDDKLAQVLGENAKLKESLRKMETKATLDRLLEKSGIPMAATNAFREMVKDRRNSAEIESQWKVFKEAFTKTEVKSELVFGIEKKIPRKLEAGAAGSSDFSDCVTE